MIINTIGHKQKNAIQNVALLFFPLSGFDYSTDRNTDGRMITSRLEIIDDKVCVFTEINDNGKITENVAIQPLGGDYDEAAIVSASLFDAGVKHTGIKPAWGTITGIRPANFVKNKDINLLSEVYRADKSKLELCFKVLESEKRTLSMLQPDTASLYVAIPFCPTRCKYCSFVSHAVEKSKHLLSPYVDYLCRELELLKQLTIDLGIHINTIYIGGGTPTTLPEDLLLKLMEKIALLFDTKALLEYTVEAGRPDTINKEKLQIIKEQGAKRISINPQTMNDKTLKQIGRNHTSGDIIKAFETAKSIGFDTINMDLIAGLEGETIDDFIFSVDRVLNLNPENITVHTLSVKRAAFLRNEADISLLRAKETQNMLEYSQKALENSGYLPYYLYRQKNMVGNLENVGYAKPAHEGLYNTYMMGEYQTVLAVGAGGVSKVVSPVDNKIERIFNYKYPYEYIGNFNKTIENINALHGLLEEKNGHNKKS